MRYVVVANPLSAYPNVWHVAQLSENDSIFGTHVLSHPEDHDDETYRETDRAAFAAAEAEAARRNTALVSAAQDAKAGRKTPRAVLRATLDSPMPPESANG